MTQKELDPRIQRLKEQISQAYLGNTQSIDWIICCLLARGHVLLEDVPGVGKTLLASTLARSIDSPFNRVQLTPDMLPADLIGITMLSRDGAELQFQPGPLFTNILLADEINRTTPRTQSALLEAMSESQVSVDGKTYPLDQPFMVVATQNPSEFEGTYPLPENQLDRFLMRISIGYPTVDSEIHLLDLRPATTILKSMSPAVKADEIIEMQSKVDQVHMSEPIRRYIVEIANATRAAQQFVVGLSPRGSLALAQAARALAFMNNRDHVIPDDIRALLIPVCAHRVVLDGAISGQQWKKAAQLIEDISHDVPSPA